jgi:tRNA (adenine22-N1)-methyltransferase
MEAVAAMVTTGNILADVGTDHGYIPIALVQQGRVPCAIAMDLREGPLERAREHIAQYQLQDKIQTRLSDGVAALKPQEVQSIVIAGMGGDLILHILQEGMEVCRSALELILQPQSQLREVRAFLREHGFVIVQEDMVCEDGKFYPMMRVQTDLSKQGESGTKSGSDLTVEDMYGPLLLLQHHEVLAQYLQKEHRQQKKILQELCRQRQTEEILSRMKELEELKAYNERAQQQMAECTF